MTEDRCISGIKQHLSNINYAQIGLVKELEKLKATGQCSAIYLDEKTKYIRYITHCIDGIINTLIESGYTYESKCECEDSEPEAEESNDEDSEPEDSNDEDRN